MEQKSADALGMELHILGMNTTWHGLGSKIQMVWEWIQDKHDEDILLFVGEQAETRLRGSHHTGT
jgi:hypothetical protein